MTQLIDDFEWIGQNRKCLSRLSGGIWYVDSFLRGVLFISLAHEHVIYINWHIFTTDK